MIHAFSDDILEKQLSSQYQSFSKLRTVSLNSSLSPAVQFVQHLMQTPDDYLARKLALLIGKGAGVGGVGQREATEEERRILFSGLSKSKEKGGKKEDFLSKAAASSQIKAHQEYLSTAYDLLPSQTSPFFDFLKNNMAYQAFNHKAKVHHAVKTKNWQELATELSPDITNQLKTANAQISAARQIQLTEYVFTLPKTGTDRSQFIGLASKLLKAGKDDYNQEVLKGLVKLKTSAERQKFATQVLDKRFWEKDEQATCLKVQMAAAKLPDSLFYKLSTLHEKVGKDQLEPNQLTLVDMVASVPAKDQESFVENVSDLVSYDRKGKVVLEIASVLKGIANGKQRTEFVRNIKEGRYDWLNWFNELNKAEDNDYVQSLSVLASISSKDTENLHDQFRKIHVFSNQPIFPILKVLSQQKSEKERQELIDQALKLSENIASDYNVYALTTLAETPKHLRTTFINKFLQLDLDRRKGGLVLEGLSGFSNLTERQSFMDQMVKALKFFDNTSSSYEIFEEINKAPTGKRQQLLQHVSELMKLEISVGDCKDILQLLSPIGNSTSCQNFIKSLSQILSALKSDGGLMWVLHEIKKIPVNKIESVLVQVSAFTKDKISWSLCNKIINFLVKCNDSADGQGLVQPLSQILSQLKSDTEKGWVIDEIERVPVNKIESVLVQVSAFAKDKIESDLCKKLINFLGDFDSADGQGLVQPLSQILLNLKSDSGKGEVIDEIKRVVFSKRAHVLRQASLIVKSDMDYDARQEVIKLLNSLSDSNTDQKFAQHLSYSLSLIKNNTYKGWFIGELKRVPTHKLSQVLEQLSLIVRSDIDYSVRSSVIHCLSDFDNQQDRQRLAQPLSQLFSLIKEDCLYSLVHEIKNVPVEKRSHVVEQTAKIFELVSPGRKDSVCKEIIQHFSRLGSNSEREYLADLTSILMQLPNMDKETLFDIWEVTSGVAQADRGAFVDQLSNIILEFDSSFDRRQVLLPMKRVVANNRLSFVQFINDNQVEKREYIEALAHLTPDSWEIGLENLREDRRKYSSHSVKEVKANQVYQKLDNQAVRVNREALSKWKLPEIQMAPYTADQMQKTFANIVKGLNLTDATRPDYVSASLLDDSSLELKGTANRDKFHNDILPKVSGFLKTLWNVSLSRNETSGWQMYDDNKPAFRKALSYILEQMTQADAESRMMLLNQLVNGLLHCPTGQKEAVDTVVQSLVSQTLVNAETFQQKLDQFLAVKKNEAFRRTMISGSNTQNVHILSYYHEKLGKTLGLSSSLGDFKERIGRMGHDPFSGYEGNALQAFYQTFNPSYLTDAFHSHVQTKKDFALHEELETLKRKVRSEKDNAKKEQLSSQLNALKQKYTQITRTDRPFTATMVYNDLMEKGKMPTDSSDGWEKYFSDDPIMSTDSFELTKAGARQYLIDSGLLLEKAK